MGSVMKAVVFEKPQTFPVLTDMPKPVPGPGEVLLKVAGAGCCHSDVALFHEYTEEAFANSPHTAPPYILGHENSGWVEEVGSGVTGVTVGDAYLVYGPIGCGHCRACSRGQATYCENVGELDYLATGIGLNGGMAEYVTVPAGNLVPLGDADPVAAAPLADAGLTPYHAIRLALPHLNGGGKTALVIGLGGLGLIAVQILKALTGATVIATDMKEDAMAEAESYGAVTVPGGEGQVDRIRELTGGRGVDAVFDFVGFGATVTTAMQCVAQQGRVTVVGLGDGSTYGYALATAPYEAELVNTYWGTIEELHDVVAMYRAGQITPKVTTYRLDEALDAYRLLVDGKVSGRAVVVPNS